MIKKPHTSGGASPGPPDRDAWFHGSPQRLRTLRAGSTVTRDRRLAEAFAHKPTLLCREDDGAIRHNGTEPGWLHVIDEPLASHDLEPHPRTSMDPGLEWLTTRPLRLRLLGPAPLDPAELLDAADLAELRRRAQGHR